MNDLADKSCCFFQILICILVFKNIFSHKFKVMWCDPKKSCGETNMHKTGGRKKGQYKHIINLYVLCDLFFNKIVLDFHKARLVQVVKYVHQSTFFTLKNAFKKHY